MSERRSAVGRAYHESALRGVRNRADHSLAYAALVAGGAVLVLIAVASFAGA